MLIFTAWKVSNFNIPVMPSTPEPFITLHMCYSRSRYSWWRWSLHWWRRCTSQTAGGRSLSRSFAIPVRSWTPGNICPPEDGWLWDLCSASSVHPRMAPEGPQGAQRPLLEVYQSGRPDADFLTCLWSYLLQSLSEKKKKKVHAQYLIYSIKGFKNT